MTITINHQTVTVETERELLALLWFLRRAA